MFSHSTVAADTCHTAGVGRQHFPVRLALPCADYAEASAALGAYAAGRPTAKLASNVVSGDVGVVMMFTGQGSQYAGMFEDAAKIIAEVGSKSRGQIHSAHALLRIRARDKRGLPSLRKRPPLNDEQKNK